MNGNAAQMQGALANQGYYYPSRQAESPPMNAVEYAAKRRDSLRASIASAQARLDAEQKELEQIERMLSGLNAEGTP